MKLPEKAAEYASNNALDLFREVIEKAYIEGYRVGYQDGKDERPYGDYIDVKFIDMGLPSKTLWADGFLMNEKEETTYFPYCEAESFELPTEEQWLELQNYCSWYFESKTNTVICVGLSKVSKDGHLSWGRLI